MPTTVSSKKGVHFSDTDTYAVYQEIRISTTSTDEPVSPTTPASSFGDLPETYSIASTLRPRFLPIVTSTSGTPPSPPASITDSHQHLPKTLVDTVDGHLTFPQTNMHHSSAYNNMTSGGDAGSAATANTWNVKQRRSRASIEAAHKGRYLSIGPANGLTFDALLEEPVNYIQLTNLSDAEPVAFKVKTTSPEKFRVRPSLGYVLPGETVSVEVGLLTGYALTANRDKFLILSARLPFDPSEVDFADFWHKMEAYLRAQENGTRFDVGSMSEAYATLAQQQDAFRMRCNIVNLARPEQDSVHNSSNNGGAGGNAENLLTAMSNGTNNYSLENLSAASDFVFTDKELGIIAHKIDRLARANASNSSGLLDTMLTRSPRQIMLQMPNFFFNFIVLYILVKLVDWVMSRYFNQIEPF